MFIEVQISTARIFETLREGLREALQPITAQEWTAAGQTLMFDHIDVLNDTGLDQVASDYARERWNDWFNQSGDQLSASPEVAVPATPVIVHQSLTLYPVLLLGRGTDTPTLVRSPSLTVTFSLRMEAIVVEEVPPPGVSVPPTAAALRFTAAQVAFQAIPDVAEPLAKLAEDALVGAIGSRTLDLPSTPLGRLNYSNGGVTSLAGGGRLAIRFQAALGGEGWTAAQWTSFYQGASPDLTDPGLGGGIGPHGDWGVRIDSRLIADRIQGDITYALTKPGTDLSKVWLEPRGVQVDVVPAGGHMRVVVSLYMGVATGVLGVTAEVHLTITGDLDALAPGVLHVHMAAHAELDLSLDTALLLMVAGVAIGSALGLATVIVPGGVILVPVAVLGAIALLASLGPLPVNVLPTSATPNCTETGLDVHPASLSADKEIDCTVPALSRLPLVRHAEVTTTALYVLGSDIVASGLITPLPALPAPTWSVRTWDWSWAAPSIPCSDAWDVGRIIDAFKHDPSSATCETAIFIDTPLPGAVSIVDAYDASDPHGVVSVAVVDGSTVAVSVRYDAGYLANPHPISVLVHTTAGVQLVALAPPPPIDIQRLTGQMMSGIADCFVIEDPFFARFHRYNPKWGVDPYGGATGLHWWDAAVTGLQPGESVEVYSGRSKEPVSRLEADQRGSLQVTLLTRPVAEGADEFAIERAVRRGGPGALAAGGDRTDGGERSRQAIRLTQTLLGFRSTIETLAEVLAADLGLVRGTEILSLIRAGAVDIYDVSAPDRPQLIASYDKPGCIGTAIGHGRLLLWGPDGLDELDADPLSNRVYPRSLSRQPVLDVAVGRAGILVLDESGLAEISETGEASALPFRDGGRALAVVGETVVVAREDVVDVFRMTDLAERTGRVEGVRCEAFFKAAIGGSRSRLVARTGDGYVGVDVSDPSGPRLADSYRTIPMHAMAVGSGRTLANRGDDGISIQIHTITARRQR